MSQHPQEILDSLAVIVENSMGGASGGVSLFHFVINTLIATTIRHTIELIVSTNCINMINNRLLYVYLDSHFQNGVGRFSNCTDRQNTVVML